MGWKVDLRSDTVTLPTEEMRRAMYEAELGDDVYGEDPTVNRLEELAAEILGMGGALFLPSGTMANQVAVLTHTGRGGEVVLGSGSHIYNYEVGGLAVLSGVQARTVDDKAGVPAPREVEGAIRGDNLHLPKTELICLENTHNLAGGAVIPPGDLQPIREIADRYSLGVHIDGARIFNAAVSLGVPARRLAGFGDSVSFCLSKGLSAPVGSMLTGDGEFIERARRNRKLLGGGMRQAGVLAAAGIVALETMRGRLGEDHGNARRLARGLSGIRGLGVDVERVETNIVNIDVGEDGDAREVVAGMARRGVLCAARNERRIRMVTHRGVCAEDIDRTVDVAVEVMGGLA